MELQADEILDGLGGETKRYGTQPAIAGVEFLPLRRIVDDRGLFMEIYRTAATQPGTEALVEFFAGMDMAQLNYSLVTTGDHIKGLHAHLKQSDVWFCPPPSKLKVVLFDVRKHSPSSGRTQVVVLGEGRDGWLKIPPGVAHGYRPLTSPCALLYLVTRCFDLAEPDERRIPWDHPAVKDLWAVRNE